MQCTVNIVQCTVQCTVLCTVQCTVYTVQCTVYTVLCTGRFRSAQVTAFSRQAPVSGVGSFYTGVLLYSCSLLCTVYYVQFTVQFIVYSLLCTVYCEQFTVYSWRMLLFTILCSHFTVNHLMLVWTLYSLQFTVYSLLYSLQFTMYNLLFIDYRIQCTVNSWLCIVYFKELTVYS